MTTAGAASQPDGRTARAHSEWPTTVPTRCLLEPLPASRVKHAVVNMRRSSCNFAVTLRSSVVSCSRPPELGRSSHSADADCLRGLL